MEALYLLLSITSTFLTSSLLSLLLLIRTIFKRLRDVSTASAVKTSPHSVCLYEGTVWHERRRPVRHSFQYSVRYALFDLDHAPHPPPDHLSADDARRVTCTDGPVLLLTIPSSVGYEQNPLSLYYCYDLDGTEQHLSKCIAEVTNTPWGERVRFVFNPNSDLVAKPLHVSPFMDMLGNWSISTAVPGDNLSVSISVQHPELGDYFVATLKAKRISSVLVSDLDMFFWLMPHKVALWIYLHALKLWWKNVPFIQHPRCNNPSYREEASIRDRKLQCCKAVEGDSNGSLGPEEGHPGNVAVRSFKWRDAKWPWY
ncbi:hypothetical protein K2173_005585 [Erythroxylum novogranatense]|uniref:DUF1365 domain-containing protein n=1 Tax=Erythroxylum novogranatense TaxID=1862640 RepID=A0AAV8T6E9_9ROSI|nr:hypothetical protein K2173_005585 [Erythroxylum novogranatense]